MPFAAFWGAAASQAKAARRSRSGATWATDVTGASIDSGHFVAEENPDATVKALLEFFHA